MISDISKRLAPRFRPSFTLVELLVGLAIIGVMAGMVLFSLAGAQQDANIAKTRKTVEKLNAIILQEWEKFRYRAARIDIDPTWLRPQRDLSNPTLLGQPALSPREGARLRMIVLRDLMRMEMPDRLTDVLYPPTAYKAALRTANNASGITGDDAPYYVASRVVPGKLNNFRAKIGLGAIPSPYFGAVTPIVPAVMPASANTTNQGAEWLYQIVAAANYNGGSALEGFRSTEIGDTDGDGMPEFIDAWGTPIRWLRWPSGYASPLNDTSTPDAMDPVRADWRWSDSAYAMDEKPWLLVPLVISAGPDREFNITFDITTGNPPAPLAYASQTWSGTNSPAHSTGGLYYYPDPYIGSYDRQAKVRTGAGLGSILNPMSRGASDNITNYNLILE